MNELREYPAENFKIVETKLCINTDKYGNRYEKRLISVVHLSDNRFARRARAKLGPNWYNRVKRGRY